MMKINTTSNTPITVGGETIGEVEFSLLSVWEVWSTSGRGWGTDRDVTTRIGKVRGAFVTLKNVWASKQISLKGKNRLFNSTLNPSFFTDAEHGGRQR
jgi:hypothetical protein